LLAFTIISILILYSPQAESLLAGKIEALAAKDPILPYIDILATWFPVARAQLDTLKHLAQLKELVTIICL
jgi:hypothetical protein